MKKKKFKTIALVGIPRITTALETHQATLRWLKANDYNVLVEKNLANLMNLPFSSELDEIGKTTDLVIVIGGDGNMLGKARFFSEYDVPLIGINKGNLGFLTDISPLNLADQLQSFLINENYFVEERFLLQVCVERQGKIITANKALNEILIQCSQLAKIIEFEVYINDQFAFVQRSDGLLVSTPTGSTAYSLSAGGPILTPGVQVISILPILPHTLSSRPLIIDAHSEISLKFAKNQPNLAISCDSQEYINFKAEDKIIIHQAVKPLKLVHLSDYNYFNVLSSKLGWLKQYFN